MPKLTSDVETVPKIGPKYQKILEKLEISSIEDLIYHFPFRYDDLSVIKKISELRVNDVVTTQGTLESINNIYTRNKKRITKAIFSDGTDKIDVTWFNMHYLKRSMKVGALYNISGKVGSFNNKSSFIAPEVEESREDSVNTGRLVPVYSVTAGLSSKWLRARNNDVLGGLVPFTEFLPDNILEKHNLIGFEPALKAFHFPDNWDDVKKARDRFSFEEMFIELLKVEHRKAAWGDDLEGHKMDFKESDKEVGEFIAKLPFELSESQKSAYKDILKDLSSKHPMNRLLEGDVGSGKTIVAVIASYFAKLAGFKTLYMAPTEILAKQHLETFNEFFKDTDMNISLKTGSSKVFDEEADVIIGTHALIYLEDKIENVGLIVIDEQQRFGVEQRVKLMELGSQGSIPHLLTMTATPIPRTLALTLYGDLDISSIKAAKDRYKNIKTWIVSEKKRKEGFNWVAEQNVPVFVVCPLIEESEHEMLANVKAAEVEYERLVKGPFNKLKVGLLHGRMKPKDKEEVVRRFRDGEIQVLVSTPVIEVGIDIPDATVMIIESAERYGLASLHQLRGRIGRAGQEAYCMLFMTKYTKTGQARLKNLEKHDSGLKLAEIDMSIRGQGDLYGTRQHGFVQFRVADPADFELLDKAKKDAINYYPHLYMYKDLQERVRSVGNSLVGNN
ncbi:ATP-dependent DNA helicase RecG [candidate division WWE3 bacterium]|jgi:ATP-dependent DNA helicase RecG|nr:ATP-dependent DNA helicase RecG [candidate division WWE3 bacterium]MBT7349223.1 ATP-dependent DNA helicase RecG [candidate division WWE3 bacterium]